MVKLYPPQIEGTIPAFYGKRLKVPYEMNAAVSRSEIAGFALRLKTIQNNKLLYVCQSQDFDDNTVTFEINADRTDTLIIAQLLKETNDLNSKEVYDILEVMWKRKDEKDDTDYDVLLEEETDYWIRKALELQRKYKILHTDWVAYKNQLLAENPSRQDLDWIDVIRKEKLNYDYDDLINKWFERNKIVYINKDNLPSELRLLLALGRVAIENGKKPGKVFEGRTDDDIINFYVGNNEKWKDIQKIIALLKRRNDINSKKIQELLDQIWRNKNGQDEIDYQELINNESDYWVRRALEAQKQYKIIHVDWNKYKEKLLEEDPSREDLNWIDNIISEQLKLNYDDLICEWYLQHKNELISRYFLPENLNLLLNLREKQITKNENEYKEKYSGLFLEQFNNELKIQTKDEIIDFLFGKNKKDIETIIIAYYLKKNNGENFRKLQELLYDIWENGEEAYVDYWDLMEKEIDKWKLNALEVQRKYKILHTDWPTYKVIKKLEKKQSIDDSVSSSSLAWIDEIEDEKLNFNYDKMIDNWFTLNEMRPIDKSDPPDELKLLLSLRRIALREGRDPGNLFDEYSDKDIINFYFKLDIGDYTNQWALEERFNSIKQNKNWIYQSQSYNGEKLCEGDFYKIQIAYIDKDDVIGYFSTIGVVKLVSEPKLTILNLESLEKNPKLDFFVGKYDLTNAKDKTEKVYSYYFKIFDENNNVVDSVEGLHNYENSDGNYYTIDEFQPKYQLEEKHSYRIVYGVKTINGLEIESEAYTIEERPSLAPIIAVQILPVMNKDDGYMQIHLVGKSNIDFSLLRRDLNNLIDSIEQDRIIEDIFDIIATDLEGGYLNNSAKIYNNLETIWRLRDGPDNILYNNLANNIRNSNPFKADAYIRYNQYREARKKDNDVIFYQTPKEQLQNILNKYNLSNSNTEEINEIYENNIEDINNLILSYKVSLENPNGIEVEKIKTNFEVNLKEKYNKLIEDIFNIIHNINIDNIEESYAAGHFQILRASEKSNYKDWTIIKKFIIYNTKPSNLDIKDFTVEQGVNYVYAIQQYNTTSTLLSDKLISDPVMADFEDCFLYDGERQLKIKFNPKISSFKETILENKMDTIGGKYPFIFRNGYVSYKEFPISGLISYNMDENKFFMKDEEMGLENDTNIREGNNSYIHRSLVKKPRTHQLVDYNYAAERIFKLKVLEFLNDGEPKLFKSPGEGNYMVRLMNCSLTPNDTLGRLLHTFNATAYEVAEFNYNEFYDTSEDKKIGDRIILKTVYLTKSNFTEEEEIRKINMHKVYSILCEDMTPGQIIRITKDENRKTFYQDIVIGVTGVYKANFNYPVYGIEVVKTKTKEDQYLPLAGQITYGYKRGAFNEFDTYAKFTNEDITVKQFIGDNNSIVNQITDTRTKFVDFSLVKFYVRDIYFIYENEDGNYYYTPYADENELVIFNPLYLYQYKVNGTETIMYIDGKNPEIKFTEDGYSNNIQLIDKEGNVETLDLSFNGYYKVTNPQDFSDIYLDNGIYAEIGARRIGITYNFEHEQEILEPKTAWENSFNILHNLIYFPFKERNANGAKTWDFNKTGTREAYKNRIENQKTIIADNYKKYQNAIVTKLKELKLIAESNIPEEEEDGNNG